jgi:PAS domain S-box-containing protein
MADALELGLAFQLLARADGGERRFTYLGDLCHRMTGLAPKDVLADPARLYDQVLPEHRPRLERAWGAAMATLSRFEVEVRMRRADGEERWRRVTATPRPLEDGWVVWDGVVMDTTEARAVAEAVEEQRRRLAGAVEATGLGFWEWDVPNGRVAWSERNAELFGAPGERRLTIERYEALVHPDDREAVRQAYRGTRDQPEGGDFLVEHRIALSPDGKDRWVQARGRVVKDAEGVKLVVGTTLDITERKAAEERRSLLLGELAHRAKNGIQVMMGIVAHTARGAVDVRGFEDVLMARLQAMADSQDLVTASGGLPVPLADVVAKTLTPFAAARFRVVDLGDAAIGGDVAVALGLLLHELSTNAVKYGALSAPAGRVEIARVEGPGGQAALAWVETGGPKVRPASRKGFGSRLLEVCLRPQGGQVEASFDPEGFRARISFPMTNR